MSILTYAAYKVKLMSGKNLKDHICQEQFSAITITSVKNKRAVPLKYSCQHARIKSNVTTHTNDYERELMPRKSTDE